MASAVVVLQDYYSCIIKIIVRILLTIVVRLYYVIKDSVIQYCNIPCVERHLLNHQSVCEN